MSKIIKPGEIDPAKRDPWAGRDDIAPIVDDRPTPAAELDPKHPFVKIERPFLEGVVKVQTFASCLIGKCKCRNCNGEIGQRLIVPEDMVSYYRTPEGEAYFKERLLDLMQTNHVCSLQFEGRDNVDDFWRRINEDAPVEIQGGTA